MEYSISPKLPAKTDSGCSLRIHVLPLTPFFFSSILLAALPSAQDLLSIVASAVACFGPSNLIKCKRGHFAIDSNIPDIIAVPFFQLFLLMYDFATQGLYSSGRTACYPTPMHMSFIFLCSFLLTYTHIQYQPCNS